MDSLIKIRQNIHTYPFKYAQLPPAEFFAPEAAAIYIHIPFCSTKCHFCDFTVYVGQSDEVRSAYVDRLCTEIRRYAENRAFPRYTIEAIYFGGGTPGLLSAAQLLQILQECRDGFDVAPGSEIGVEFDPNSVTLEKLVSLREGGFTRFSVGAQSFDAAILKQANRPHDAAAIDRAMQALSASGFTHTNIDLLYPLPGLTPELWAESVERALEYKLAAVSLYGLEVWPGTGYYHWLQKGNLPLPSSAVEVEMYLHAVERLEAEGYVAGSINGYYHPERASRYCRFLEFYWRTRPMIGFGVSSRSAIGRRLWTNVKPIKEYIKRIDDGESTMDFGTTMSKPQEMRRIMIRGLKTCEVKKSDFYERFGVHIDAVFGKEIAGLVDDELVRSEPDRLVLTRRGRAYGTTVYQRFFTNDDMAPPAQGEVQYGVSHLVAET